MRYFPLFIDLKDRPVVVVGGGEAALRKVRLLLKTGARISVIATTLHDELAAEPRVNWIARRFDASLLDGAALVFSADTHLNPAVAAAAKARGIPVNAVDDAEISTFIVPSIVDRDPVVVAIGTEGTAPVLGRGLRERIDAMLPQALGPLARAAAALRARVAETVPAGNRRRSFWRRFFFGDVRDAFIAGDATNYAAGVETLLTNEAAPPVGRVSFVAAGPGDPELLTLKAQRKLQEADVIVHDQLTDRHILELARRDATRIPMDKLGFAAIDAVLIREARAGRHVVRLGSGDTFLEERVAVAAEGIAVETVPAVEVRPTAEIISFPVREDIRDAVLRAAS
jgi:uroporphyrin-III C-methyltransferase / precorrin-2 dehydrogenase / sirohydrochlorin ferrochelatase